MNHSNTESHKIQGHLDIFISRNENEIDGKIIKSEEILIHGNPEGLKSLAQLLIEIADINQETVDDKLLPIGAREHFHLRSNIQLSKSSIEVIIGRLDAKGTGNFYDRFIPKVNIE